jgi:RimJ/RimL family protein N-acetyltransferase
LSNDQEKSAVVELSNGRIRLRPWREADRAPFAALNADPRVMEFYPSGLSCAVVDDSSQLTPAERAAMVAALPNNVPQWAQAQKTMVNAGQAKGQGDPLWELSLSKKA